MAGANTLPLIDTDALPIDPLGLIEALRQGHAEGVEGLDRSYLEQTRPGAQENGFLVWPAWQHGQALGAKLVTIFPGNDRAGLGPNIRSVYVLFDGNAGTPLAVMTGEAFTRHKTAADSALGASFLARDDARCLAVLGAGAQAETHIRYLCAIRPSIERVMVWNRGPAKAEILAASLRRSGIDAIGPVERQTALQHADIVTCLTASSSPVLEGRWLRAGTHVDLVGGFTPTMRESDDETILKSRIFVDHRGLVSLNSGDLRDPLDRGIIGPEAIIGDLFDLCSGSVGGRRTSEEITLFKNGGGGHLDLMAAIMFYGLAPTSSVTDWIEMSQRRAENFIKL